MNDHELRRLIRTLTAEIRILREEVEANRHKDKAAAEHRAQQPIRPLQAEVQTDSVTQQAIREHYTAENRERNSWWGRNKRWIEAGGVTSAAVLVFFNLLTFIQIKKQTPAIRTSADVARTALVQSERAWLTITISRFDLRIGSPIGIPVRILNTGKTAARRVVANIAVSIVLRNQHPDFVYDSNHSYASSEVGLLTPGTPLDGTAYLIDHPTKRQVLLTQAMLDQMNAGTGFLIVHATTTYEDMFKTQHWINFCSPATVSGNLFSIMSLSTNGSPDLIAYDDCKKRNDIDDN